MAVKITFEVIKEPLEKVLRTINQDRSKFKPRVPNPKNIVNAEKLDQAAGNHMFDDNYKLYGITKNEGHCIREYFQATGLGNRIWRDYIEILHREFSQYLDPEDPLYIGDVNTERKHKGQPLVKL